MTIQNMREKKKKKPTKNLKNKTTASVAFDLQEFAPRIPSYIIKLK